MEIKNIVEYIEAPYNLNNEDFESLKSLIEQYPFFQTANMLLVKAAHNIKTEDYSTLIAKVSSSVPNRELLFKLINFSAPVKAKEVVTEKKEESDTRKEIRQRIKKRREKRMVQKGNILFDHGSSVHEKIVENFFKPIIEKLLKDEKNIGLSAEEISKLFPQTETVKTVETKDAEREKRRIEREKRMEEKMKRRMEEQEAKSDEDIEKEKQEREKRRLDREKRMEARKKLTEEEEKNITEQKTEEIISSEDKEKQEREKRRLEREKRMEERRKLREQGEKGNIETEKKVDEVVPAGDNEKEEKEKRRIEREKRMEERLKNRQAKKSDEEKSDADNIASEEDIIKEKEADIKIEDDPFTNIIKIGTSKEKEDPEKKEEPENIKEESDDLVIIVEEDTKKTELKEQDEPKVDQKEEIFEIKEETEKKETEKKEEVGEIQNRQTIVEEIENKASDDSAIEDIYDKIISSKKPSKKQDYDFIEIKDDITGLEEKKESSEKEKSEDVDIKVVEDKKEDNLIIDNDDTIEFEIEDTTSIIEEKTETVPDKIIKTEKPDGSEEVFELLDKEEDLKDEKPAENKIVTETEETKKETGKDEVGATVIKNESGNLKEKVTEKDISKKDDVSEKEDKLKEEEEQAKAAESVFARIEAFKKKRANKSEKSEIKEDNKYELIDKFVKEEPPIKRPSTDEEIDENVELAEKKSSEKKPVVTELMASIYVNQAKYDEAIEIYEKLILKNPEKKDYFAAKIEETKKLK